MTGNLDLEEFTWADLAGDRRYNLVIVWGAMGSGEWNEMWIYSRSPSGKLSLQCIDGGGIGLNSIWDINGDGKDELVVPQGWGAGADYAAGPLLIWYRIYKLKNGEYVEATREFGSYYDKEVFPQLDSDIASLQKRVNSESATIVAAEALQKGHFERVTMSPEQQAAVDDLKSLAQSQMTRDKMVRVLGRDPKAGEKKALEWLKDPLLSDYGGQVLMDIGGHDAELQQAQVEFHREWMAWRARRGEKVFGQSK